MRLEHDQVSDAAYLYLVSSIEPGASAKVIVCEMHAQNASVHLDVDSDGRLLGVEILGASQLLHPETLAAAQT